MLEPSGELIARLRSAVGTENVLLEPDRRAGFERDWTGRFQGRTPAVVLPGSAPEVAAVLKMCGEGGAKVVPQGGNTGHVGGSVPLHGEIVLSLRRLAWLEPVDLHANQVTVGAGTTLAALLDHVHPLGLTFGVDLSPKEQATIGGMVATNAGGLRFLRYGSMRHQLIGIEAVLADGTVIRHLLGLAKDNTGYDLGSLICGSEGTLAVVTAACLRLVPKPSAYATALISLPSFESAVRAVNRTRATGGLEAAEIMFPEGMRLMAEHLGDEPPVGTEGLSLLVELAGSRDPGPELASVLRELDLDRSAVLATEDSARADLWRWRTGHSAGIGWYCQSHGLPAPHKFDLSLPPRNIPRFLAALELLVRAELPAAKTIVFGHVGDGNLHVNLLSRSLEERIDEKVLRLAAQHGGSISAEHGIGTAKSRYLHLNRSPEELRIFGRLKSAFDPSGILNPHVLQHHATEGDARVAPTGLDS